MTPEMWGKPIDVASEWIDFVDDGVLASKLPLRYSFNGQKITTLCTRKANNPSRTSERIKS